VLGMVVAVLLVLGEVPAAEPRATSSCRKAESLAPAKPCLACACLSPPRREASNTWLLRTVAYFTSR
jgi:hypothetical protein